MPRSLRLAGYSSGVRYATSGRAPITVALSNEAVASSVRRPCARVSYDRSPFLPASVFRGLDVGGCACHRVQSTVI